MLAKLFFERVNIFVQLLDLLHAEGAFVIFFLQVYIIEFWQINIHIVLLKGYFGVGVSQFFFGLIGLDDLITIAVIQHQLKHGVWGFTFQFTTRCFDYNIIFLIGCFFVNDNISKEAIFLTIFVLYFNGNTSQVIEYTFSNG